MFKKKNMKTQNNCAQLSSQIIFENKSQVKTGLKTAKPQHQNRHLNFENGSQTLPYGSGTKTGEQFKDDSIIDHKAINEELLLSEQTPSQNIRKGSGVIELKGRKFGIVNEQPKILKKRYLVKKRQPLEKTQVLKTQKLKSRQQVKVETGRSKTLFAAFGLDKEDKDEDNDYSEINHGFSASASFSQIGQNTKEHIHTPHRLTSDCAPSFPEFGETTFSVTKGQCHGSLNHAKSMISRQARQSQLVQAHQESNAQINNFLTREKVQGHLKPSKVLPKRDPVTRRYMGRTMIGDHQTHQDALEIKDKRRAVERKKISRRLLSRVQSVYVQSKMTVSRRSSVMCGVTQTLLQKHSSTMSTSSGGANKYKFGKKSSLHEKPELNQRQFNTLCKEAAHRVAENKQKEKDEFQQIFTKMNKAGKQSIKNDDSFKLEVDSEDTASDFNDEIKLKTKPDLLDKIKQSQNPTVLLGQKARLNSAQGSRYTIHSIKKPSLRKEFPLAIQLKETKEQRRIENYEKYQRIWNKYEEQVETTLLENQNKNDARPTAKKVTVKVLRNQHSKEMEQMIQSEESTAEKQQAAKQLFSSSKRIHTEGSEIHVRESEGSQIIISNVEDKLIQQKQSPIKTKRTSIIHQGDQYNHRNLNRVASLQDNSRTQDAMPTRIWYDSLRDTDDGRFSSTEALGIGQAGSTSRSRQSSIKPQSRMNIQGGGRRINERPFSSKHRTHFNPIEGQTSMPLYSRASLINRQVSARQEVFGNPNVKMINSSRLKDKCYTKINSLVQIEDDQSVKSAIRSNDYDDEQQYRTYKLRPKSGEVRHTRNLNVNKSVDSQNLRHLQVNGINQLKKEINEISRLSNKRIDKLALHRNEATHEIEGLEEVSANRCDANKENLDVPTKTSVVKNSFQRVDSPTSATSRMSFIKPILRVPAKPEINYKTHQQNETLEEHMDVQELYI